VAAPSCKMLMFNYVPLQLLTLQLFFLTWSG